MSKQYDNTNTFTISRNNRKRAGKKDPDLTGKINIEGQWYWLSAWQREDRDGNVFYSGSANPQEGGNAGGGSVVDGATQRRSAARQNSFDNSAEIDDDVPF